MEKIIDCHTHLQTSALINEYFKNRSGFAIVMKALDSLIGNGDSIYSEITNFDNIFLCECIDAFSNISIEQQLINILDSMNKHRVIGIKIYLGYQPIFADDEKLIPVYKFAEKHKLSVAFHCGIGAENLEDNFGINYATCRPIKKIAKQFPKVNFIISHFCDPDFEDCLKIITENKNVFTDISGEYENFDNMPYSELVDKFIVNLAPLMQNYPKQLLINKIMFGTDYFGIGSGFSAVEEYISTLDILFGEENRPLFLFDDCLNAYPKLKTYLQGEPHTKENTH